MAYLGISGPSAATDGDVEDSRTIARWAARAGHVVVCGGLGGVMAAAAQGAAEAGGVSVGLLPGDTRDGAAPGLTVALPTGLGELRNGLLVRAVEALVCVGGSWGTLSELALAVRTGVPVVALRTWLPDGAPLPSGGDVVEAAERSGADVAGGAPLVVGSATEACAALERLLNGGPPGDRRTL
jgi:uncharacterized protein (TIGR00725 family)